MEIKSNISSENKVKHPMFTNFDKALEIEIQSVKNKSYNNSILLTDGKLEEQTGDMFIYAFRLDDPAIINEDMPVEVSLENENHKGNIISVVNKVIRISTNDNLGDTIRVAQLKTDQSFLTERLKERLDEVSEINDQKVFNLQMALKTLGIEKSIQGIDESIKQDAINLNDNQFKSIQVTSKSDVLYLWGPPGTGKTFTLAELVYFFYKKGKKILLVSNTNMAVDILLKSLCKQLLKINDPGFKKASVLRFGKIVNEELLNEFGDYVSLDQVVLRLTEGLQKKVNELDKSLDESYSKMKPIDENIITYKKYLKLKEDLQKIDQEVISLQDFVNNSQSKLKHLKSIVKQEQKELDDVEPDTFLGGLSNWAHDRRSREDILTSLSNKKSDLKKLESKLENAPAKFDNLNKSKQFKSPEYESLKNKIKSISITYAEKEKERLEKHIRELSDKRSKLQKEINEKKDELLLNCTVTAATATQTYLKPKQFNMYDLVIIDESSMLQLPAVAYVSGLAKEKVTVAGDFKQLPPIVNTREKDKHVSEEDWTVIENWLEIDIFTKAGIADAVEKNKPPLNLVKLRMQYRMEKKICDLINNRFYYGDLLTHDSAGAANKHYPDFFNNPLILIDTQEFTPFCNEKPRTYSKYNILHAVAIRNLIRYLAEQGTIKSSNDVGYITPYKAQATLMRNILDRENMKDVECGTVHRFQGNEKDIIIFDTVESYGIPYIGKQLNEFKTMNVALSRSKAFLVVVGNIKYLEEKLNKSALMKDILFDMHTHGETKNLAQLVELSPESLARDVKKYEPKSTVDYKDREITLFNEEDFYKNIRPDIVAAKKWIIIYSAFCTEKRVAWWADLLRTKIAEGVKVKCAMRPPKEGVRSQDKKGYQLLMDLGVTVDLRHDMHEKCIWIDDNILWTGSLNPLSNNEKTSEDMMRINNPVLSLQTAQHQIYNKSKKASASGIELLTKKENPKCPECGSDQVVFSPRSYYKSYGFAGYFKCYDCKWTCKYDKWMDGSYKENTSPKKVTIKKSQSKEDIQIIINKIIKLREHGKRKKSPHTPLQENTFLKSFTKESGRGSILEKLRNGHSLSPAQQKSLDKMFNDYE